MMNDLGWRSDQDRPQQLRHHFQRRAVDVLQLLARRTSGDIAHDRRDIKTLVVPRKVLELRTVAGPPEGGWRTAVYERAVDAS